MFIRALQQKQQQHKLKHTQTQTTHPLTYTNIHTQSHFYTLTHRLIQYNYTHRQKDTPLHIETHRHAHKAHVNVPLDAHTHTHINNLHTQVRTKTFICAHIFIHIPRATCKGAEYAKKHATSALKNMRYRP